MIYAGIGARGTPQTVCTLFRDIGAEMARRGHTLRSGYARGADMAFFEGAYCQNGMMENYIPWPEYNQAIPGDSRFIVPMMTPELIDLAKKYHPAWGECSTGAKKLHARNGCQILGLNLNSPVDMVICWTVGGYGKGGTGQALRIAKDYSVPIFDFGDPKTDVQDVVDFVKAHEHSMEFIS